MYFERAGGRAGRSRAPDSNPGRPSGDPSGAKGRRTPRTERRRAAGAGGRCPPGRAGERRRRRRRGSGRVGAGGGAGDAARSGQPGAGHPPPALRSGSARGSSAEAGARGPRSSPFSGHRSPSLRSPRRLGGEAGGGAGAPRGRGGVEIYRGRPRRGRERERAGSVGGGGREGGRGAAEHRLAGKARDQMPVRKGGSRHRRDRSQPRRSSGSSPGRRPDARGARLPPSTPPRGRLGGDGGGRRAAGGPPGLGCGRRRRG